MPKIKNHRERYRFRAEFGDDGRLAKFILASPKTRGQPADCCTSCVSDQTAIVVEASENAKHLIGTVQARDKFLAHETKEIFTSDGKPGYVSGVVVRDVC